MSVRSILSEKEIEKYEMPMLTAAVIWEVIHPGSNVRLVNVIPIAVSVM